MCRAFDDKMEMFQFYLVTIADLLAVEPSSVDMVAIVVEVVTSISIIATKAQMSQNQIFQAAFRCINSIFF